MSSLLPPYSSTLLPINGPADPIDVMVSPEDRDAAAALKDKGNAAFKDHDWPTAVDFYSQAIEKDNTVPAFFSNRAQAQIKLEAFGYCIADATKAIELDANFAKVCNSHTKFGHCLTRLGVL